MKKRALSLFLACCMLVLTVPALILPAYGDGVLYTTKFEAKKDGSNAPTASLVDGVLMADFKGNWSLVKHEAGDWNASAPLNAIAATAGPLSAVASDCWFSDGKAIRLWDEVSGTGVIGYYYGGATRQDDWGASYSICPGPQEAVGYQYLAERKGTITITLDSLQYILKPEDNNADQANTAIMGIFVDGKMVWPNVGDNYGAPEKWDAVASHTEGTMNGRILETTGAFAKVENVVVQKGSKIEFLVRTTTKLWHGRGVAANMTVDYTSNYTSEVTFSSSYVTDGAAKITYHTEDDTVSYGGDWYTGIIDPKSTIVKFEKIIPNVGTRRETDGLAAITSAAYPSIVAHPTWSIWGWGSHPGAGGMNLASDKKEIGPSNCRTIATYFYEVKQDGEYNIYPSIEDFIAPGEEMDYNFCIMVNEKMVWPVYGGSWSYQADKVQGGIFENDGMWYNITSETTLDELNNALAGFFINVKKGDRVEFCVRGGKNAEAYFTPQAPYWVKLYPKFDAIALSDTETAPRAVNFYDHGELLQANFPVGGSTYLMPEYTGKNMFCGWDINGDGVADALPGQSVTLPAGNAIAVQAVSLLTTTKLTKNWPTVSADGETTFNGNWVVGVLNADGTYEPFRVLNEWDILTVSGSPWGGTGGGLYMNAGSFGKIAFSGATAEGAWVSNIRYTTEYSGKVTLDFDKLIARREVNDDTPADYIAYNLAIYQNGKKIWPASGDWYVYQSEEICSDQAKDINILEKVRTEAPFPANIAVAAGDTIEFRIQQGNANSWMFYSEPVVTYTELSTSAAITADSVTVGKNIGLNFYVQGISLAENSKVGLEYFTTEPGADFAGGIKMGAGEAGIGDTYKFSYTGLAAKQMADTIWVRPYVETDGNVVYGAVTAHSVRGYADRALKGNDAVLNRLLVALLNYGTNAQSLLDYNRENLANANLSSADKQVPELDPTTLDNAYAQSGTDGKITSVALILDNQLGFKFLTAKKDGATNYKLEIADNASFTGAQTIDMAATEDGDEYKAIAYLSYADLGKTWYVRVTVDGTAGATLTYNVDAYMVRMLDEATDGLYYLMCALDQLKLAAAAYLA